MIYDAHRFLLGYLAQFLYFCVESLVACSEEEMPTEEGMVFPPPANEPESPVYLPAFSSKVPQRWIYSPVISLEMEMSDKVLRNGRCTSEVASTIDKIVAQ